MRSLQDLTACIIFVPFKNVLKGFNYSQIEVPHLSIDFGVPVGPHEKMSFFDAQRHLSKDTESLFS